ncbi:MAG: DUF2318 domain-containing protein [Desulfovibrio sp.]|nr:DUF2318 domain-containing protein [Desulfovibrio sp.]
MRSACLALITALLWTSPVKAALFDLFRVSPESVSAKDGLITLDAAKIAPGTSRHYRYQENKTKIRFFVVRDQHNTIRAALDACEVCKDAGKGYAMKDKAMFCNNCGRSFALIRIGAVTGGCNPHPVSFSLDGGTFTITTQELVNGAGYFPENGR